MHAADFVTIGVLVALEGLLSADNALVMAIMVLGLPRRQHHRALRSGLLGAFAIRIVATLVAAHLVRVDWVKLVGGTYLFYLTHSHFWRGREGQDRRSAPKAKPWLGMSAFWATVVRVELVNLAFSIDSIMVAVAMSPKLWVLLTGGILGILALRLVVGQLIVLVDRYPALVDGAFVIIAWIAAKLWVDYLHAEEVIGFDIPQWVSLAVIVVILAMSLVCARIHGPVAIDRTHATVKERAEALIAEEGGAAKPPGNEQPRDRYGGT